MEASPGNGVSVPAADTTTRKSKRRQQIMPEESRQADQLDFPQLMDWYTVELKVLLTTAKYLKMELKNAETELAMNFAMNLVTEHYESLKILERILQEIKSNVEENIGDTEGRKDQADEEWLNDSDGHSTTLYESGSSDESATDIVKQEDSKEETSQADGSHKNSDAVAPEAGKTNIKDQKRSNAVSVSIEPLPKKILHRLRKHRVVNVKEVKCDNDKIRKSPDAFRRKVIRCPPRGYSVNNRSLIETGRKGSNYDNTVAQHGKMSTDKRTEDEPVTSENLRSELLLLENSVDFEKTRVNELLQNNEVVDLNTSSHISSDVSQNDPEAKKGELKGLKKAAKCNSADDGKQIKMVVHGVHGHKNKSPTPVKATVVVMRKSARKRTPARPLSGEVRFSPTKKNRPRTILVEIQENAENAEAYGDHYPDASSGTTNTASEGGRTPSVKASAGGENKAPLRPDDKLNRSSSSPSPESKTQELINYLCEKCGESFRFWSALKLHSRTHT